MAACGGSPLIMRTLVKCDFGVDLSGGETGAVYHAELQESRRTQAVATGERHAKHHDPQKRLHPILRACLRHIQTPLCRLAGGVFSQAGINV